MDKETLSNYGWIVICVLVLAVMLALASPFGKFISTAVQSTTQGLFDVNQEALGSAGIEIMQQEFENVLNGTNQALLQYNKPYSTNFPVSENLSIIASFEFYEDGTYTIFYEGCPIGDGTYSVENGNVYLDGDTETPCILSQDGTQISADEMTFKVENGNLPYFGKPYVYTIDGTKLFVILYEDGSLSLTVNGTTNTAPAGTVTYENGRVFLTGEPEVSGRVSDDRCSISALWIGADGDEIPKFVYEELQELTLVFEITQDNRYLVGYTSDTTKLVIPETFTIDSNTTINGITYYTGIKYKVTSIEDSAFRDCNNLISIEIPDSITFIGAHAFQDCSSLVEINIPNSITSIEPATFYGCSSLTSINIPDSITSIGHTAFCDCSSLIEINIPSSVTTIEMNTFNGCSSLTSINIPDSVTFIGSNTFDDCSSLTEINIPNSVLSTGSAVFQDCSGLVSLDIPDNITTIENHFVNKCTSLTSINIPNSITLIEERAFQMCTSLTSINYNGTMDEWNAITKEALWNSCTGNYTIYCTDGEIAKS